MDLGYVPETLKNVIITDAYLQFKEGQSTHDIDNPLELPDDDPTTTLNLFLALHGKGEKTDKTDEEWIQQLVALGDK